MALVTQLLAAIVPHPVALEAEHLLFVDVGAELVHDPVCGAHELGGDAAFDDELAFVEVAVALAFEEFVLEFVDFGEVHGEVDCVGVRGGGGSGSGSGWTGVGSGGTSVSSSGVVDVARVVL